MQKLRILRIYAHLRHRWDLLSIETVSILVGGYVYVPATRSYIVHCRELPLPVGAILLRYALVVTTYGS